MPNALPFMNCEMKRLINGSDGETGTDFATVNQAGLLGWNLTNDSWTYASASTITVPTNATTKYSVGDRVRFKQGAGYKYGYLTAVAATLLTFNGGSDYSVANSAITDIATSKFPNPLDFPGAFNWAPTLTGFSVNPTNTMYRFSVTGRRCFIDVRQATNGTSDPTTGASFTISLPVTAATITNGMWLASGEVADNGALQAAPGMMYIASAGTVVTLNRDLAGAAFTAANGKGATFQMSYEI